MQAHHQGIKQREIHLPTEYELLQTRLKKQSKQPMYDGGWPADTPICAHVAAQWLEEESA